MQIAGVFRQLFFINQEELSMRNDIQIQVKLQNKEFSFDSGAKVYILHTGI